MFHKKIAIIGLGYVGLPLAVAFGNFREVIGYDVNHDRINDLKNGYDATKEMSLEELKSARKLTLTNDINDLKDASIYIVTVPTPVDEDKKPDLTSLIKASLLVGSVLSQGDIVIYESTVFPGATEEVCVPELEKASGLNYNIDFFCGYSPERINPGDKEHRLENIVKITSGSTEAVAQEVEELYSPIIKAGIYSASSIMVAEAAKVIENTQRDINIALMNELSLIFDKLGLDTTEVLKAAGTKWNFLPFRPGLVGGHCIGIDPYYLTHKAQSVGYTPKMILAGREINDQMGLHLAQKTISEMEKRKIPISKSHVLVLGLTFKENCPDLRNSKVFDVVQEFEEAGLFVDLHDSDADYNEAKSIYGNKVLEEFPYDLKGHYDAIILAVPHSNYIDIGINKILKLCKDNSVFFDVKSAFEKKQQYLRL